MLPPFARRVPASKIEAEIPKALKPKVTGSKHNVTFKQEEIALPPKGKDFRVVIDSDEEGDGSLSCFLVKKETGKANYLMEEAHEETLRILRKARKREGIVTV